MPYQPRYKRTLDGRRKVKSTAMVRKSSVPRAIAMRGTPKGYYEIPVTNVYKLYCNTSTGIWDTNQDTGAPVGLTGYRGLCINGSLSDINIALGEGSTSANLTLSVPGFANLQGAFDLCKIARWDVTFAFENQGDNLGASTPAAMQYHFAKDLNSFVPPASRSATLEYGSVRSIGAGMPSKATISFQPYMTMDANTIGAGSTTQGVNSPSAYCLTDSPGVAHRGIIGWLDAAQPSGTAKVGYLYVTIRQIRRYKISR